MFSSSVSSSEALLAKIREKLWKNLMGSNMETNQGKICSNSSNNFWKNQIVIAVIILRIGSLTRNIG